MSDEDYRLSCLLQAMQLGYDHEDDVLAAAAQMYSWVMDIADDDGGPDEGSNVIAFPPRRSA